MAGLALPPGPAGGGFSSDALLSRGRVDQLVQPLQAGLFQLRADDPPAHLLAVAGWLLLEERPRRLVLLEQPGVGLFESIAPLLVRIDARPILLPGGERLDAVRMHP